VKGSTFKRCGCTDSSGKPLGDACPRLKTKNHGTWYYAADLPPHPGQRRRYKRKGGFATRRDAQAAVAELLDLVQKRTYLDVGNQTTAEYLEQWLAGKGKLRSSTRRSYAAHVNLYLVPGVGHLRLLDLGVEHIEQLYAAMRELGRTPPCRSSSPMLARLVAARSDAERARPLSAASIRRVHATLMSALNTAAKRRLIPFNPASYVELESGRRPKAVVWTPERVAAWKATGKRPKVAVWTAEQTGGFLDHAADDRLYALYHLIAFRGLRRGEAVGLSWTDVDLDQGLVTVSWQIVQLGYATKGGEPKADSARTIALDTETIAVLRAHRARQAVERLAWGPAWIDTGRIFTREDGSELHPEYVTRHFERLCKQAGLPPIRLHDLRHGAATLALAGGADLKTVSEMLGHSTIVITADTYTSVLPEVARQAAESAAAIVPRNRRPNTDPYVNGSAPISHPSGADEGSEGSAWGTNVQVRRVGRVGLEPTTRGLKVRCSAN
jgi:integrase